MQVTGEENRPDWDWTNCRRPCALPGTYNVNSQNAFLPNYVIAL